MSRWILRRLQKRAEKEWREYEHKISFGPLLPRRARAGEPQIYRSFVQIHFHPRERGRRNAALRSRQGG